MKIMIMGAGAVGGYFGSRLQLSGQDMYFIARGDHCEVMREKGLRVEGISGDVTLEVKASNEPSEFGEMDLVILCVKSQDTHAALEQIGPCVSEDTLILTLQNGVENEAWISARYGIESTIGGVAYIGVGVERPGIIVNQTHGRIAMGRLVQEGVHEDRFQEIVKVITNAGISLAVTDDIMKRKWGKLTWNAVFNPVSVLTDQSSYVLKSSPGMRALLHGIIMEVILVAHSEGIVLDFESITRKMFDLPRAVEGTKTSMLQDFEKGKPLELEALNGVVVRKGRGHGIPTPLNEAIMGLVKAKEMVRKAALRLGG